MKSSAAASEPSDVAETGEAVQESVRQRFGRAYDGDRDGAPDEEPGEVGKGA